MCKSGLQSISEHFRSVHGLMVTDTSRKPKSPPCQAPNPTTRVVSRSLPDENSPLGSANAYFYGIEPPCFDNPNASNYIFKPLPAHIGPSGMSALVRSGALTVPDWKTCGGLLAAYIDFVYPCLPALDLAEFLESLSGARGTAGSTSLLLFQAVMFAGAAFVDMKLLTTVGYLSRIDAQRQLFQKVEVCYPLLILGTDSK